MEAAIPSGETGQERIRFYPVDITQDDRVLQLSKDLLIDNGRVDALVHSAGAFAYGEWGTLPMEELDFLYKINLRAPVLLTKALLPSLRISRGQIVFINSSAVLSNRAKVGAYSVTKHGLRQFADSLREEVNPEGIRVISAYPGRTATRMQELVCKLEGSEYQPERLLRSADVALAVINAMCMPNSAEVTDLFIRSGEMRKEIMDANRTEAVKKGIER
jgi:short-subunit dehydrogenase